MSHMNPWPSPSDPASPVVPPPPHNEEAEQALLGALLINNKAFDRVSDILRAEHFYDPGHAWIFERIAEFLADGRQANPVTLKRLADTCPELTQSGGGTYLVDLIGNVVTIVNTVDYARTIVSLYQARQTLEAAYGLIEALQNPGNERRAADVAAEFATILDGIGDDAASVMAGFTTMRDGVQEAIDRADAARRNGGGLSGLSTGLIDLDKLTGGLQPGDLIILAGRPSMGKTTIAKNIAVANAKRCKAGQRNAAGVGFFSLEMSAAQLAANYLAEETGVDTPRQRQGELHDHEFVRMTQVDPDIPFWIDTTSDTLPALLSRAKRMVRKLKVGLIVVDYLQLMSLGGAQRTDNRVQEISTITRALKKLARDLQVPVLALSQLSRAVEQREDKRPQLSDLRDSGSIEQDADVVMFAYREQYYLERAEPARRHDESDEKFNDRHQRWQQRLGEVSNIAEIGIAKQRMGSLGIVRCHFDGPGSRFSDLDTRH